MKMKWNTRGRCFTSMILYLHTFPFVHGSSCPSLRQYSAFVFVANGKADTSDTISLGRLQNQQECEIECVNRFECSSYDYSSSDGKCELNFNNYGDVNILELSGWVHVKKKLITEKGSQTVTTTTTSTSATLKRSTTTTTAKTPITIKRPTTPTTPQPTTTPTTPQPTTTTTTTLVTNKPLTTQPPTTQPLPPTTIAPTTEEYTLNQDFVVKIVTKITKQWSIESGITIPNDLMQGDFDLNLINLRWDEEFLSLKKDGQKLSFEYQLLDEKQVNLPETISKLKISQNRLNSTHYMLRVSIDGKSYFESYEVSHPKTILETVNITSTQYKQTDISNVIISNVEFQNFPDGITVVESAESCEQIKDAFPGFQSGNYWLSIDQASEHIHCDMENKKGYKINQHKLVKEIPLVTKTWSLEFSILYSTVLTQVKPEVNIIDFKPRQPSSRSYSFSIQLQGNNTLSFQYEFRGTKTEYKIKLANTIDIKIHQKFKEEDTYNVTYYIDNVRIKEFDITNPSTQKDMIISSTECTIIETHPEEKTSFLAITEEPKFKVFPDGSSEEKIESCSKLYDTFQSLIASGYYHQIDNQVYCGFEKNESYTMEQYTERKIDVTKSWSMQFTVTGLKPSRSSKRLSILWFKVSNKRKVELSLYNENIRAMYTKKHEFFWHEDEILRKPTSNFTISTTRINGNSYTHSFSLNGVAVEPFETEDVVSSTDVKINTIRYENGQDIVRNLHFDNLPDGSVNEPTVSCQFIKEKFTTFSTGYYYINDIEHDQHFCDFESGMTNAVSYKISTERKLYPIITKAWALNFTISPPMKQSDSNNNLTIVWFRLSDGRSLHVYILTHYVYFTYRTSKQYFTRHLISFTTPTNVFIHHVQTSNTSYNYAVFINGKLLKQFNVTDNATVSDDVLVQIAKSMEKDNIVMDMKLQNIPDGKHEKETATSCKEIKNNFPLYNSGVYWVDIDGARNVYCDMSTDNGGWLMIGNVSLETINDVEDYEYPSMNPLSSFEYKPMQNFVLDDRLLKKLKNQVEYKEIRIYCTKPSHGRVFHAVINKPNMVNYISGINDDLPSWGKCKEAVKYLEDDTSLLSSSEKECNIMSDTENRLYNHVLYTDFEQHVQILPLDRLECDDYTKSPEERTGTWSYYVR